jgi:hypothetical protein
VSEGGAEGCVSEGGAEGCVSEGKSSRHFCCLARWHNAMRMRYISDVSVLACFVGHSVQASELAAPKNIQMSSIMSKMSHLAPL